MFACVCGGRCLVAVVFILVVSSHTDLSMGMIGDTVLSSACVYFVLNARNFHSSSALKCHGVSVEEKVHIGSENNNVILESVRVIHLPGVHHLLNNRIIDICLPVCSKSDLKLQQK